MNQSLNRVTAAILLCFALVAGSLTYWSVFASDSMLARDDNPRRVEDEQAIVRGAIYDRNGQLLAQTAVVDTAPSGQQVVRRDYPRIDAASAVGYYSLIHGVGGAEAAFDPTLRGDDLRGAGQIALDRLLHRPTVGSDVRLTLDATLQTAIAGALNGRKGAVIVIDAGSGAVLAMVSAPIFDPNKLNATYDTLLHDPTAPLLNRVTQGIYQPGGALETVILAAILGDKKPLDAPIMSADTPVSATGLTLACAGQGQALTVGQAYNLACPAPFADAVINQPGAAAVQKVITAFGLLQAPPLARFETVSGKRATTLTEITDAAQLRIEGAGQGELTVTPLQMALVACTIANHGHSVIPYLGDATRQPGTTVWQPIPPPDDQTAVTTRDTANTLRTAMRDAVTNGAAKAADRPNVTIYGHASIAYTGPKQNADSWFIGFVDLQGGRSIAVAVVVEDTPDASVAANIGGLALAQAAEKD